MMEMVNTREELLAELIGDFPTDAATVLNICTTEEIVEYLEKYPVSVSVEMLFGLNSDVISRVVASLDDQLFRDIFMTMDGYRASLLISRLPRESIRSRLELLEPKRSAEIREYMNYPTESAGFLMDTQINTFHPESTVEEALDKVRTIKNLNITNIYVADVDGDFLGKISIQKLAVAESGVKLKMLVEDSPRVNSMAPKDDIIELFEKGNIISLPVVDVDNRLLGIIRHDSLVTTAQKEASEDALAMFGAGREEKALSTAWFAVKKRLPWLQINLATAFLAASIVGMFEETIAKITVLAVFLPVVAGQSGNTGSQALAVTIRGLALREFRMNQWFRVAMKELSVGFINGVAVAITTGTIVYFWASSFGLGVVIAVSMVISMVIAGFSGAVIPIVLKSLGQDPAQSSSIVLTTVTDIVGFLSFLGLATAMTTALGIA